MNIQPGTKIYCEHGGNGTVGLLVRKKIDTGKLYLMTAWHVLDNGRASGPTAVKLNTKNGKTIAAYTRSEATCDEKLDVAIAEVDTDIDDLEWTNRVLGASMTLKGTAYPTSSTKFRMRGAASKFSDCRLDQYLDSFGNIEEAYLLKAAEGADPAARFCKPGDSGAIWWSEPDGRMIGLHSKGDMSGEVNGVMRSNCAAAVSIVEIFNKLDVELIEEAAETA